MEYGRMVTSPAQPEFIGANVHTNNTAELTAVHHALRRIPDIVLPDETVFILSDSALAINTTIGAWAARKHKALVRRNREAHASLKRAGIRVHFMHIRAHRGHYMNERADRLARQGAQGLPRCRDHRGFNPPPEQDIQLAHATVPD